MAAVCCNFIG